MTNNILDLMLRIIILILFCFHSYDYHYYEIVPDNFDVILFVFLIGNSLDRKTK